MLKLYNTLTRTIDEVTVTDGVVSMHTCGPTVYKTQHIGNMRSFFVGEMIVRALMMRGFTVKWIVNITDVGHPFGDDDWKEDKLALEADARNEAALDVAREFEEEFYRHWRMLHFVQPLEFPRASEHIPEILALVEQLVDAGFAYQAGPDIAFDVGAFPKYGVLSRHELEKLGPQDGDVADDGEPSVRRSKNDFALWRGAGERTVMEWESPWGPGYPGWHIEDTAFSFKYLGREHVDIHTGGEDLKFPHHEAEVAQAEALLGRSYVRLWVHVGHVLASGRKMAKSTGNIISVDDVAERIGDPLSLRYLYLSSHYRRQIDVTWDSLASAASALDRLRHRRAELGEAADDLDEVARERFEEFMTAVEHDLDLPTAMSIFHGAVNDEALAPGQRAALMDRWDDLLALDLRAGVRAAGAASDEVQGLVAEREAARAAKDWAEADRLRDLIAELGFRVEDRADGPLLIALRARSDA